VSRTDSAAREIADAASTVPAVLRDRMVVVTTNYGEAGAVNRYGGALGLPRAYSGHNQLYDQGPPPVAATVVVMVGAQLATARTLFRTCHTVGRLDDQVGVDNEEQGQPVAVCRGPVGGWATAWPALRHLD
jgi:hypothetical protein